VEFDAGGANAGFGVGDAEEDDLVAAALELSGQGGHGVDMTCSGEAECSKSCHSHTHTCEFGPVESTPERRVWMVEG